MKKFSRIGAVLFGLIVAVCGVTLPGCQTAHTYSRNVDANAFDRSREDGPSCRFG